MSSVKCHISIKPRKFKRHGRNYLRSLGSANRSIPFSEVKSEKIDWMWFPYIAFGKCAIIEGHPGQGKSFLTVKIAACMSRGEMLPEMREKHEPVTVLMAAIEDGAGDTIKPRLEGCGAALNRIHLFNAKKIKDDFTLAKSLALDAGGLKALRAEIEELGAKLVIIDALNSYLPPDTEITKNTKMRQFIDQLVLLAAETGAAIVIVRHLRKGSGPALLSGAGVMDTIAGVRTGLTVAQDPSDETRSIAAHAKHNNTARGKSFAWRITKDGKFAWDGGSDLTADDLVSEAESGEERSALTNAVEFLKQELADGPVLSAWLFERGKKERHAERTIRRASDELKVVKRKTKKEEEHYPGWVWSLPEQVVQEVAFSALLDKLDKLDTLATVH